MLVFVSSDGKRELGHICEQGLFIHDQTDGRNQQGLSWQLFILHCCRLLRRRRQSQKRNCRRSRKGDDQAVRTPSSIKQTRAESSSGVLGFKHSRFPTIPNSRSGIEEEGTETGIFARKNVREIWNKHRLGRDI